MIGADQSPAEAGFPEALPGAFGSQAHHGRGVQWSSPCPRMIWGGGWGAKWLWVKRLIDQLMGDKFTLPPTGSISLGWV